MNTIKLNTIGTPKASGGNSGGNVKAARIPDYFLEIAMSGGSLSEEQKQEIISIADTSPIVEIGYMGGAYNNYHVYREYQGSHMKLVAYKFWHINSYNGGFNLVALELSLEDGDINIIQNVISTTE